MARDIGLRQEEGSSLNNLGVAHYFLGEYEKAIDYLEQTLAIAREIGDLKGEAGSLGNLGSAYLSLGQYQKAIDHHHCHDCSAPLRWKSKRMDVQMLYQSLSLGAERNGEQRKKKCPGKIVLCSTSALFTVDFFPLLRNTSPPCSICFYAFRSARLCAFCSVPLTTLWS